MLPERDCDTCNDVQARLWGCEDEPEQPLSLNGEWVKRCPRRLALDQPDELRQLLFLYRNYTRGLLPNPGSVLDQSAYLMTLFEVLDGAIAQVEQERVKEAERKAQKGRQAQQPRRGGRGA